MIRAARLLSLAIVSLAPSACTVSVGQSASRELVRNQCSQDSDCGSGTCWLGACVAHEGTLSSLLFEITPPADTLVPGVGGIHYLQMESSLGRSNEQHDLDLNGAAMVHGYIKSACPFDVTLTPQEQSYGLPVASYVTHTTVVPATVDGADAAVPGACGDKLTLSGPTQAFVVAVPPGTFDVYVRPSSPSAGAPPCDAVPQLFRGLVRAASGLSCYTLPTRAVTTLDVRIPWPATGATLDGWTVDVIHPVTGQVLSETAAPLAGSPAPMDGGAFYSLSIKYSQAVADDRTMPGQEILRLSPPKAPSTPADAGVSASPTDGPVIQLSLAGLMVSPQKAVLPEIGPFPQKVRVEGWVWSADDFARDAAIASETPVPSTVTFTATKLDALPDGVFASFSTTAAVGRDGHLSADLFPGDYRVRVVPELGQPNNRHLAAQETTWSARLPGAGVGAEQAGHVLLLSNAATISGHAVTALQRNIAGAAVQATAGAVGTRRCAGADASACNAQPIGVLETSFGDSAFVPRTATGVTGSDGTFSLTGVDCGGCTEDNPAVFDVIVQPTDGTRLPWIIEPGVSVSGGDKPLGVLQASLPIIQRGAVEIPQKGSEPIPVPGALVRAYLLRDATGATVLDPTGLPSCSSGTYNGTKDPTRCIRSAIEVAETRADADASYELVVPSSVGVAQ